MQFSPPRSALLEVAVVPRRSRVVVVLDGELDLGTVGQVRAAVDELLDVGWRSLTVDFSGVSFVDSSGLRALLEFDARARVQGWRFALAGSCAPLERVLEVTGLSTWFVRA